MAGTSGEHLHEHRRATASGQAPSNDAGVDGILSLWGKGLWRRLLRPSPRPRQSEEFWDDQPSFDGQRCQDSWAPCAHGVDLVASPAGNLEDSLNTPHLTRSPLKELRRRQSPRTSTNGDERETTDAARPTETPSQTSADQNSRDTDTPSPSTTRPPATTTEASRSEPSTTDSPTEAPQTSSNRESTSEAPRTTSASSTPPQSSNTTSSPTISSATSTSTTEATGGFKSPLSRTGIIVASVSGTVALIAIILLVIFCVRRRRRKNLLRKVRDDSQEAFLSDPLAGQSVGRIRKTVTGMEEAKPQSNSPARTQTSYREFGPPAASSSAPWLPTTLGQQPPAPPPAAVAAMHPPGGYTRRPRTSSSLRSSPSSSTPSGHPLRQHGTTNTQPLVNQYASGSNQPDDHLKSSRDSSTASSFRRSFPLPMSVPPAPIQQQQSESPLVFPPSIQQAKPQSPSNPQRHPSSSSSSSSSTTSSSSTSYQAYRPFSSRYQPHHHHPVPNTIPEEEPVSPLINDSTATTETNKTTSQVVQPNLTTTASSSQDGLPSPLAIGFRQSWDMYHAR